MNEFEQRLRRVPLKTAPPHWRAQILDIAAAAPPSPERGPAQCGTAATWLGRVMRGIRVTLERDPAALRQPTGWRSLFWPHPQAWSGLAAVWVVIALLHFSQRDEVPALAEKSVLPSSELRAELKQQQQMLVELLGPYWAGEADRPKRTGPHTQLVRTMLG